MRQVPPLAWLKWKLASLTLMAHNCLARLPNDLCNLEMLFFVCFLVLVSIVVSIVCGGLLHLKLSDQR